MLGLVSEIAKYLFQGFRQKMEMKEKVHMTKLRLAESTQTHNQDWELRSLENSGWKDDVLFYAIIGMFVWAGFDPDGARQYFENLKTLPEWFVEIFGWVVASVLGVKKIGDTLPGAIRGVRSAFKADIPKDEKCD